MIVQTRIVGDSSGLDDHDVAVPADVVTMRQLLGVLVRHELAAYNSRREANRALRVLTPADLARGVETGSYGREVKAAPSAPTYDDALARAIEAFDDGLYFAFLDGSQVGDLDSPLPVRPDSTLRLVRLVALAGG